MSARTARRSRLAVRYFDDRILLTETHGWAYYRLPTVSYEFTTPQERESLATNITVALAAIRMTDAEVHLRIAHRPYPAAEWATGLDATSDGGPGWLDYLDEMYRHVWAKDFWTKEIYLGVRLGQRGMRAQLSGGVFSQFINLYQAGEQAMGLDDEAVGPRRDRPLDRPGRAARPGAGLQRARRPARHLGRHRLAVPAHADGHRWATRGRRPRGGGSGAPARSSRCSKARCTTGAPCCGLSTRAGSRTPRSCPSPGSPTSCTSPTASRGCTTPTRCRSRSRSACG